MLISNRLNASSVPDNCGILPPIMEATECPGSQWEAVLDWLLAFYNNVPAQFDDKVRYLAPPFSTQVTGKNAVRQLHGDFTSYFIHATNATSGDPTTFFLALTVATTQQIAVADALVNTATLWAGALENAKPSKGRGSAFRGGREAVHYLIDYYQPYVKSYCAFDTINSVDDQSSIFFPVPDEYLHLNITVIDGQPFPIPAVEYPPLRKYEILELPGSPLNFRFKWVEIPANEPDRTSLGFVALQPQQEAQPPPHHVTSNIIVCRIDAGWGKSSMNTSSTIGSITPVSSFPDPDGGSGSRVSRKQYSSRGNKSLDPEVSYYQEYIVSPTLWSVDEYPQIPIRMTPGWAEFLNPVIPTLNDTVLNVLFSIVEDTTAVEYNVALAVQSILSLQVANALGRIGLLYQF